MYLTKSEAVSRLLLQSFLFIGFAALAIQKIGLREWLRHLHATSVPNKRRVLLVSTPDGAERYAALVRNHASINAELVGVLIVSPMDGELNGTGHDIPSLSGKS